MSENYYEGIVKRLKEDTEKLINGLNKNTYDFNNYISAIKSLKATLELIKEYDWNLMYSIYKTRKSDEDEWVDQISVWEQNSNGDIRNHECYSISKPIDTPLDVNLQKLLNKLEIEYENKTFNSVFSQLSTRWNILSDDEKKAILNGERYKSPISALINNR